jgi:hypothetical protein
MVDKYLLIMSTSISLIEETERIKVLMSEQVTFLGGPSMGLTSPERVLKLTNWIKTWDKHDWLTFIDVTATALGMVTGPAAPFFFGVALAAALTDSALYFKEDDPYMGGIVLALSIIPFGELVVILKKTGKLGPKATIETLEKVKTGKASKQEKLVAKEIITEIGENSEKLARSVQKNLVKKFLENFAKLSLRTMIQIIVLLIHTGKAVGKLGIVLGGIYYTYDEIYLGLNYLSGKLGLTTKEDQKKYLKIRYNSKFQNMIRMLKVATNQQTIKEQSQEFMELNSDVIEKNPNLIARVEPESNSNELEKISNEAEKKFEVTNSKSKESPSVQDVLSGKIDPQTKLKYVIKRGMKGESVYYVQKLLKNLDYSDMLTNFKDNKNPTDSNYGENTETSVYVFQGDNGINQTGVVDQKTLNTLIKQNNIKKNEK